VRPAEEGSAARDMWADGYSTDDKLDSDDEEELISVRRSEKDNTIRASYAHSYDFDNERNVAWEKAFVKSYFKERGDAAGVSTAENDGDENTALI